MHERPRHSEFTDVARWSNVHVLMMGALTAALNRTLPPGLEARPEEEVRVESIAGERLQAYRGDIAVADLGPREPVVQERIVGGVATMEPIRISYHRGPIVLRNVQIVDTRDRSRIVTVIEVLSPWNKLPGQLNRDYVRNLKGFEQADASWVEIDLLRSSRNHLPVTWDDFTPQHRADYLVLFYRAKDGEVLGYPISLRQRLPTIRVPLRESDEDAQVDLQSVMDRVYQDGPFASLDYTKPPIPPLTPADATWATELLSSAKQSPAR